MQQRKISGVSGRPTGTDGSDYSYRMVVESRYTRVAKGKSRLYALIVTQGIIQLVVGLLSLVLSIAKKEIPDKLAVASTVISLLSFLIGEIGRIRSKANLLKFFIFASSAAVLLSMICAGRRSLLAEFIQDPSKWKENKVGLLEVASVLFGFPVQILAISTTISLIYNMSPPKRAS